MLSSETQVTLPSKPEAFNLKRLESQTRSPKLSAQPSAFSRGRVFASLRKPARGLGSSFGFWAFGVYGSGFWGFGFAVGFRVYYGFSA